MTPEEAVVASAFDPPDEFIVYQGAAWYLDNKTLKVAPRSRFSDEISWSEAYAVDHDAIDAAQSLRALEVHALLALLDNFKGGKV